MCTVIVVNHHHKEFPLVVAANRDEDYSRASSPVGVLSREPIIIGGKDEVKGGTWFGVNEHSLFVTGTNQGKTAEYETDGPITLTGKVATATLHKKQPIESRGLIIRDALKCKTLDELLVFVEELNPAKYNKFNLVFGNSKAVFMAHSYLLHSMVIRELPLGVHVISNDMKFKGWDTKTTFIHDELNHVVDMPWLKYYGLLKKILATSDEGVRIKPRKKESGNLYGRCTRSSTIVAFSDSGLERYKFYDRTAPRPKRKSKEDPIPPRYKDYIELWRNPDTVIVPTSEEGAETLDESPKEVIMRKLRSAKPKVNSWAGDPDDYDD